MVAHRGYLVFGRPINVDVAHVDLKLLKETKLISVFDENLIANELSEDQSPLEDVNEPE
jgi:hypothetical protein